MRAGSSIPHSAIVRVGGSVELGRESVVMHYTVIYGEGGVTLGDRVLVGNHCLISSTAHRYEGRTAVAGQGMREAAVIIADEAWIGAFTIVDPGVRIGRGAIVGAHSYVKEDVPDYAVVAGCPAQLIRHRDGGSIS
jgi:acetyltransferase-like isoleucine patch superfamily enzyme